MQNTDALDELLDASGRALLDGFAQARGIESAMLLLLTERVYREPGSSRDVASWTISAIPRALAFHEFGPAMAYSDQLAIWAPRNAGEVLAVVVLRDGRRAVGTWPAATRSPFHGGRRPSNAWPAVGR